MDKNKKQNKKDMPNQGTTMEMLISRRVQLGITVAGVVVALFNIWIATKLAPIAQDLAVLETRVSASEIQIVPRQELENQFDEITSRLDRIENKLDRVIENK